MARGRKLPVAGGNDRRLIVNADDFGVDIAVNEAVEQAFSAGVLTSASLMMGAPATADAVDRARRLKGLAVGLHVTVADGRPVLSPRRASLLTGRDGRFIDDLALAGFRWFASARVRNQLAEEISAQFEAFAATGLVLDHVNVHKHLHLHPTVLRLIIAIGRRFGMLALRIPEEPRRILRRAEPGRPVAPSYLGPMLHWMRLQIRARRLIVPDHCFGLAWSGAMTEERILALIPHLPQGLSELYAHPASRDGADMPHAAKGYRYREELAALTSPRVRAAIERSGVTLTRYSAEQRLAQPAAGRAARA